MRLWLTLGLTIALAVLGALCWHRGSVIDRLNQQLGEERMRSTQFEAVIKNQNSATQQIIAAGQRRDDEFMAVVATAIKERDAHNRRALQILATPPRIDIGACQMAELLIDDYRSAQ